MYPCSPCPRGTYSSEYATINCTECPFATHTARDGADDASLCKGLRVHISSWNPHLNLFVSFLAAFDVKVLSSSDARSLLSLNSSFADDFDVITVFARVLIGDVSNSSTLMTIAADDAELRLGILTSLEVVASLDE